MGEGLAMKRRVKMALYGLGDRLFIASGVHSDEGVTHPMVFRIGHWISELGWRFRC